MKKFLIHLQNIFTVPMLAVCIPLQVQAQGNELGQKIFKAQCMACHSTETGKNGAGPSLSGIVGGKAGNVPGFSYSSANKQADLVWDEVALDKFLADPKAAMPGTKMAAPGVKTDSDRKALIDYLKKPN
jgi:cytochrome c2